MGKLFLTWREYGLCILGMLDCLNSLLSCVVSTFFVLDYLMTAIFNPIMLVVLLIHYAMDGFRWQLYPLYLQLLWTLCSRYRSPMLTTTSDTLPSSSSRGVTGSEIFNSPAAVFTLLVLSCSKLVLLCTSCLFCWVFSLPSFPEPDGSWGVGVESFDFVCSVTHQQLHTPDELHPQSLPQSQQATGSSPRDPVVSSLSPRVFNALVFYPIEKHQFKKEGYFRWLDSRSVIGLSRMLSLPRLLFKYLLSLETHSVMVAPLSKKRNKYPIVFVSHGLGMMTTSHSLLCQTLASHGSIVVALEHTDGTAVVTTTSSEPTWFFGSLSLWQRKVLPLSFPPRRSTPPPAHRSSSSSSSTTQWRLSQGHSLVSSSSASPKVPAGRDARQQVHNDLQALSELLSFEDELIERRTPIGAIIDDEEHRPATTTREQEFRHAQLKVRCAEVLAAYDAMVHMSRTSGSTLRDRVDWESSSVIGFGMGGATAVLACLVDFVQKQIPTAKVDTAPAFKSCLLLCPWLDPLNESELRLAQWLKDLRVGTEAATPESPRVPPRLPQNFMMINTAEIMNQFNLSNQIRVIKLMRDAIGEKVILQFSRCKSLDLTDIPVLAPLVFRYLKLSGPRAPEKSAQMVNHVVCNFLSRHYRRSLFTVGSSFAPNGGGLRHRSNWRSPALLSVGSESETASGVLSVGSDTSSCTAAGATGVLSSESYLVSGGRPRRSLSAAQFRTRYSPSILQALRLSGIPDQYIRGLGGLRTPGMVRELGRHLLPPTVLLDSMTAERNGGMGSTQHAFYDVLEGVVEFADELDCSMSEETAGSGTLHQADNTTVAEICHI